MIGVGKDAYLSQLPLMIGGRILPWVEDIQSEGYPVWTAWEAGQRFTYFLDRQGSVVEQLDLSGYDPLNPEDYGFIMDLILEIWSQGACEDNDGDGYEDEACGGDDCDDTDPATNPGAFENMEADNCADGKDNDCDGLADADPECSCFLGMVM